MNKALSSAISLASVLTLVAACASPTPTPTPTPTAIPTPTPRDPLSLAKAYYDAYNAGDIEAFAAIFAEDIVLDFEPGLGPPLTGKLAVLREQADEVAGNPQISFSNPMVERNTFTAEHSYQGVPRDEQHHLIATMEIVVAEGRITSITVTLDEESLKKIQ